MNKLLQSLNSSRRGQGATEYIVVLAIVLMVALVVVGLLGFFPGFSTDTQASESATYWQSARPLAVTDAIQNGSSGSASGQAVSLVVENHAPASITITTVNLTAIPANLYSGNGTSITLSAGERATILVFNASAAGLALSDCWGRQGKTYSYNVTFVYNQDPLTGKVEKGSKPLVVSCT